MSALMRLWPLAAGLFALTVLFGPGIASGHFWAPSDGISQTFPQRALMAWSLSLGELPFWNPYNFGGMPLMATIHPGLFYPLNWPGLCLPFALAADVTVGLAYMTACASTWCLIRALGLPRGAAAVASLTYAFGGFMLMHAEHVMMLHVAGLVPLLLWALVRYADTFEHGPSEAGRPALREDPSAGAEAEPPQPTSVPPRRYAVATALIVCAMIVAGHPQMAAYGFLVAGAYALFRLAGVAPAARRRFLAPLTLAGVLGLGLSLLQLLPTLALIAQSQRQAISYGWLTVSSVPLPALPGLLMPMIYGARDPSAALPVMFWSNYAWLHYLEGYVGLSAWLLAGAALARLKAVPHVRFFVGVAGVGFVLALGATTPVYKLWALLPVVNMMPYASRHFMEFNLAMAVLAAYGFAGVVTHAAHVGRALALSLGAIGLGLGAILGAVAHWGPGFAARTQPYMPVRIDLAGALALSQPAFWLPFGLLGLSGGLAWALWRRPHPALQALFVGVAFMDLAVFHAHQGLTFVLPQRPTNFRPAPEIDWERGRALALPIQRYPNCYDCDIMAHIQRYHYPNLASLEGLPSINGYDAFLPARYGRVLGMSSFGRAGESNPAIFDPPHRALDLLGLTTLRLNAYHLKNPVWQKRIKGDRWQRRPDDKGLVVLHNPRALPHAWRVTQSRVLTPEAVDGLLAGQGPWDPRREALLEAPLANEGWTPGRVTVKQDSLNRVTLTTEGVGPGLVVLSQGYDAGWQATIGPRRLPLMRADGLITAIAVPAGYQRVSLRYVPREWPWGLALSLLSALLLAFWATGRRRLVAAYTALRPAWPLWGLLALLATFLGPAIARGRFWAPSDGIAQAFPQRSLVAWSLSLGELPFWNPYNFGGMPLMGAIQIGLFYPANWPGLLLPFALAADVTVALAYAIAAAGTWSLARALGLGRTAAALSGLTFAFSGFMLMHAEHVNILHVAGLVPWLLWALARYADTGLRRHLAAVAGFVALMVFAGHPQMTAYGCLVAAAYTLVRAGLKAPGERWRFLAPLLLAGVLGVGLTLMQLLPTLALIARSQRHAIDYAWLTVSSVPGPALLGLLMPMIYGARDPSALLPVAFWADTNWLNYLEGYVGLAALLFAGVALGRFKAEPHVRFFAGVAGVGFVLALGAHTPLYQLWAQLPVVNMMPYASRHFMEVSLAVAVLAGYGLQWLLTDGTAARRALTAANGTLVGTWLAVLVGLATVGPGFAKRAQPYMPAGTDLTFALSMLQPAFWLPGVWLALLGVLGVLLGGERSRLVKVAILAVAAGDLAVFHAHQGLAFVAPFRPAAFTARPALDWEGGRALALSLERYPNCYDCDIMAHIQRYHYPNLASLEGLPSINGYDAFIPERYGAVLGMDSVGHAGETNSAIFDPPHRALDLLGLTTLRLDPRVAAAADWQKRIKGDRWQRRPDDKGLVVLHNPRALPHAWRVTQSRVLTPEAVDGLLAGQGPWDPRREALLEAPLANEGWTPGRVTVTQDSLNRVTLTTEGVGPGLVVLSQGYDAGWQATIGPRRLPLMRADGLITAIAVPAGYQRVSLRYVPREWPWGLALSLLSALLLAFWLSRRRRTTPEGL